MERKADRRDRGLAACPDWTAKKEDQAKDIPWVPTQ